MKVLVTGGCGVAVVHGDVRLQSDFDALGTVDWVIDAAAEIAGSSRPKE